MKNEQQKESSKVILAFILIAIGILWVLRELGFYFNLPTIHWGNIFYPFGNILHSLGHVIFSWPMILIIIGLVLMAGKRSSGIVLIVIGGVFILPRLFLFHGFTFSIFLPLILIGVGVALVARLI